MLSIKSLSKRFNGATILVKRFYAKDMTRTIGVIAHIDAGNKFMHIFLFFFFFKKKNYFSLCLLGKTTVSERFLYFAGKIRQMGEVHDGNTSLDFMPMERERGITIAAACTVFEWRLLTAAGVEPVHSSRSSGGGGGGGKGRKGDAVAKATHGAAHRLNLLDTPGHIDFSQEVERSMASLDGAIVILDGVAGVQGKFWSFFT